MSESSRSLFIVWGPPSHGPRSRVFARELGIPIEFIYSTRKRGLLVAPWKYLYQLVMTVILLMKRRPSLVYVQSPPSFAAVAVAAHAGITGGAFVVDIHSDAMMTPRWNRPRWLHRLVRRRAVANIVTNEAFRDAIEQDGGTALIIRDIPTNFEVGAAPDLDGGRHILVVNKFAPDEPVEAVREAAELCPDVQFHMTGALDRAPESLVHRLPSNLHLTDYLPDPDYYALMNACDAVMCLTTRDNTMQRGACEALSMGRPIITSDWPLLKDYFYQGTVHVKATPESIADGVRQAIDRNSSLTEGISQLEKRQQAEWVEASRRLSTLLDGIRRG
jgi:glycosyltransferase involved in cell wall biosynthesis